MISNLLRPISRVVRAYQFWLVVLMFVIGAILHYPQQVLPFLDISTIPISFMGLERHAVERVLLLIPVVYAGYVFGIKGGIASLVVAGVIMLPRATALSSFPADSLYETTGVLVVGGLVNLLFYIYRRDNTQRKRLEDILAEIIDGSPIPSFAINNEHKVTHWNKAIEVLSGVKRDEILGTKDQWRAFYPVERPVMADLIVNGASAGEIEMYYSGIYRPSNLIDGAHEAEDYFQTMRTSGKWLRFTASPLKDSNGAVVGAIETLEDVTERKNAEAALRDSEKNFRGLFESALNAIWIHDLDGNIQMANEATAKLVGYTVDELCKLNGRVFLSEESLELAREIKTKLLKHEPVVLPYEQRVLRKDGTEAVCMLTTNLIVRDGKPVAFQNIATDVTEEKRLYQNLRFYLHEITRAQEEERKRIARELHDSTAQTLIALLHQLESITDNLRLPIRETKALWALHEEIKDVLQEVRRFSRDLRPSILDDLGLLAALEWLTGELKKEYGIEASLKVTGNERRLSPEAELILFRVVQEALRNTAKHAQASKALVEVEFKQDKIRITASDNGSGFHLPENIGTLPQAGKLGLIGMEERVQLLSGSLKLNSEVGKGTVVTVEAPI